MRRAAAVLALALVGDAAAARIESLTVTHADGNFAVAAVMLLDAPPAAVHAALTDFAHLGRLSPAILESRVVGATAEGPLVYTRSKACAFWFCRELRKTELVVVGDLEIVATAMPDRGPEPGTVSHSVARWTISAAPRGSRVEIRSEVDPSFYVPPLLGPPLVKKALRRETEALARGLERAALARGTPAEPGAAPAPSAAPVPTHGG